MPEYLVAIASAFWLGILTSISPCPLATNIAAISFVGRRVGSPLKVFLTGLLYTLGRSVTYLALGVLLVWSVLSAPSLSHALQKYVNLALGPLLILIGMVLLNMISFGASGRGLSEIVRRRAESAGPWGAFLLGILFALSFCPTSAALFFGGLLPVAVGQGSAVVLPLVYGAATGVPVMVFAVLIVLGTQKVASAFNRIVPFERWARRITGVLFIVVGVYYCLTVIYGVSF